VLISNIPEREAAILPLRITHGLGIGWTPNFGLLRNDKKTGAGPGGGRPSVSSKVCEFAGADRTPQRTRAGSIPGAKEEGPAMEKARPVRLCDENEAF
jgi:hypothetical protein